MVLPTGPVSTRMPKYTLVCEARLTPVHVIVAPPPWLATPVPIEQVPPAGREWGGPPLMISAEALEATANNARTPKAATPRIVQQRRAPLTASTSAANCPPCGRINVMTTPPFPLRCDLAPRFSP